MATTVTDAIAEAIIATLAASGTTLYVSLHSADPGETGANEITGTSYARQPIVVDTDLTAAADDVSTGGRVRDNNALIDWGNAGSAWGTVSHIGFWDSLTTGTFKVGAELTTPQTIANGNPVHFSIGNLDIIGAGG